VRHTLTCTPPPAAQNYRQKTDPEQQPFAESGGKSAPVQPSAKEGSHTARSRYSETTWGDVWSDIKLFCANPFPFLVHFPFPPSSLLRTFLPHSSALAYPFDCHPTSIFPHRHQPLLCPSLRSTARHPPAWHPCTAAHSATMQSEA
jgi:hypothetical protein